MALSSIETVIIHYEDMNGFIVEVRRYRGQGRQTARTYTNPSLWLIMEMVALMGDNYALTGQ